MGEERIELEKLNIVLFQSLAVLFSAYIVSLFKDAEYTSQTIAILYLLHFVSFYISNIAYRFYSRGYLDERNSVSVLNVTETTSTVRIIYIHIYTRSKRRKDYYEKSTICHPG